MGSGKKPQAKASEQKKTQEYKKLYGRDVRALKFGIEPGAHVAHITGTKQGEVELPLDAPKTPVNGYRDVTMTEVYTNAGEKSNREYFTKLAQMSAVDYEKDRMEKDMKNILLCVKDYITASGRGAQQDALRVLNAKMDKYGAELGKRIAKEQKRVNNPAAISLGSGKATKLEAEMARLKHLNRYRDLIQSQTKGNLKLPPEVEEQQRNQTITEPKDVFLGKVGIWKKSDEALFPHDPSPNDIKQGVGIQDCFALSVLSQMAEKDPKAIKDMMRDNGNGTVSVRFYDKLHDDKEVFVTVNKTTNKDLFGHNIYASSSLWVQMMEKAYAEYNRIFSPAANGAYDEYGPEFKEKAKSGMGSAWFDQSSRFMDAIFKGKHMQCVLPMSGTHSIYQKDESGKFINHPDYYLPEEKELFKLLDEEINKKGEFVTIQPEKEGRANQIKATRAVGIRPGHVYALKKVFSTPDGKLFVQVRDPYGTFASGYDEKGKLVNKSQMVAATVKGGTDTMGTFNLEMKDFLKYFDGVAGCTEAFRKKMKAITTHEREYDKPDQKLSPEEMKEEGYNWELKRKVEIEQDIKDLKDEFPEEHRERSDLKDRLDKQADLENKLVQEALGRNMSDENTILATIMSDKDMADNLTTKARYDELVSRHEERKRQIEGKPSAEERRAIAKQDAEQARRQYENTDEFRLAGKLQSREGFAKIAEQIDAVYRDLRTTDQMFVWTNTAKFNKMRDELSAFNKQLKEMQKENGGNGLSPEQSIEVAKKMMDLRTTTEEYIDAKQESMAREYGNGKTPSDRAMHRFSDAISLKNICSGEDPLTRWPSKNVEAMSIYRSDLMERVQRQRNGQEIPHDDMPQSVAEKALEQFNEYLEHNPELEEALDSYEAEQEEMAKESSKDAEEYGAYSATMFK